MDTEKNIDEVVDTFDAGGDDVSVDDFIKQLEEKEKDLHITAETSVIEIAEAFEGEELPDSLKEALDNADAASGVRAVQPVNNAADVAKLKRLEGEVKNLQATIAKMEADREEMFKNSQRRSKDFEAFKARVERERKETFQNQVSNVATLMLPALDNLQRALEAAEQMPGEEKSEAFQFLFHGIALVSEQIDDILDKMGIKSIRTIGEEFDPHFHEAVATEETDAYPPNTVCGEILRGYMAGERVIRHSMVKVAVPADLEKCQIEESPEPPASDPSAE